jgi:hypothetical protein
VEQKIVRVPIELVQSIANYLAARPWVEVNDMLVALSRLPQEAVSPPGPPETA